jgi:hypothetical protein
MGFGIGYRYRIGLIRLHNLTSGHSTLVLRSIPPLPACVWKRTLTLDDDGLPMADMGTGPSYTTVSSCSSACRIARATRRATSCAPVLLLVAADR